MVDLLALHPEPDNLLPLKRLAWSAMADKLPVRREVVHSLTKIDDSAALRPESNSRQSTMPKYWPKISEEPEPGHRGALHRIGCRGQAGGTRTKPRFNSPKNSRGGMQNSTSRSLPGFHGSMDCRFTRAALSSSSIPHRVCWRWRRGSAMRNLFGASRVSRPQSANLSPHSRRWIASRHSPSWHSATRPRAGSPN